MKGRLASGVSCVLRFSLTSSLMIRSDKLSPLMLFRGLLRHASVKLPSESMQEDTDLESVEPKKDPAELFDPKLNEDGPGLADPKRFDRAWSGTRGCQSLLGAFISRTRRIVALTLRFLDAADIPGSKKPSSCMNLIRAPRRRERHSNEQPILPLIRVCLTFRSEELMCPSAASRCASIRPVVILSVATRARHTEDKPTDHPLWDGELKCCHLARALLYGELCNGLEYGRVLENPGHAYPENQVPAIRSRERVAQGIDPERRVEMYSLVELVVIDQNSHLGEHLQGDDAGDALGATVDERQDDAHGLGIPVFHIDLIASTCGGGPFFPGPGQGGLEDGGGLC